MKYVAKNLEEIAALFDQRAGSCRDASKQSRTKTDAREYMAQANTWQAAATIVRQTTMDNATVYKINANGDFERVP